MSIRDFVFRALLHADGASWALDALVADWLNVPLYLMNPGPSGSGDKTVDWVHAATVLMLPWW